MGSSSFTMTYANGVTLSRLLALPVLLWLLRSPSPPQQWWALAIFLLAAATDWLDGYLARRFNQVTDLGKFLDPLVDKLLILAPLLPLIALDRVPAWGVFIILARELAIAGWRVNQAQVPGANPWGKLKTVVQILAVAFLLAPLPPVWAPWTLSLFWVAVALTVLSGGIYLGQGWRNNGDLSRP